MNELKRLAYLQAMDTDTYISLRQLPGAAPTRRLAVVKKAAPALSQVNAEQAAPGLAQPSVSSAPAELRAMVSTPDVARLPTEQTATSTGVSPSAATDPPPRFSLAAIACGGCLWLEELEGAPLAAGQVHLVQAMCSAFVPAAGAGEQLTATPSVSQFDWPIHTNRQLDLGPEAARSSAAGFIQRKLEQLECHTLVLLGAAGEAWVAVDQLDGARLARTVSTAAMLRDPLLKKQACLDLRPAFASA